jgi:hypothetical protein
VSPARTRIARGVEALVALAVLPLAAHALFSWIGFNPTDDGFILAGARRILEGQVPHRDFISIRPAGSFLLHTPEVWAGGARVFLISRAVFWFEIAAGAWCWTLLLEWARGRAFAAGTRLAVAATIAALNAHMFPAMAWHSVDAITLAAAGIAIAARCGGRGKLAGYFVLGLAPVCRQNFVPLVPLGLLLLGDVRRPRCWLAALAPAGLYVAAIAALGGWTDMVIQLGARADFIEPGIAAYARWREAWVGLAFGAVAAALSLWPRDKTSRSVAKRLGAVVAATIALVGAASLWRGTINGGPAFFLWGAAAGAAGALTVLDRARARAAWLSAAAGWCVSISIGYNTPVLAAGALAAVPAVLAIDALEEFRPRAVTAFAILLAVLAGVSLWHARHIFIYRDHPADGLTADLGAVLPGGRGIRTSAEVARFLGDLKEAAARCGGRPYAVLPDCAAWWVHSAAANPMPADWLSNTELSRPELFLRAVRALEAGRGRTVIVLQKYRADMIAWERRPLRNLPEYGIADYVRKAFRKTGETGCFETRY